MKLEVLVSTMNQKDNCLVNEMNIQTDALIINQCDLKSSKEYSHKGCNIRWINTKDRGLSKSRNMALKHATGDICLIADDDMKYVDGYENIIKSAFEKYPTADIITFQVEGIEKKFKDYYSESRKLNYLTTMKVSSVEIAFRKSSIKNAGITFNELLGSGAKYFAGEESVFLFECLKRGLSIYYEPTKIADLHIGNSSWFKGYTKEYFITKGAVFTAMSRKFSIPFILQFAVRKHKLYRSSMTLVNAIKFMLKGRKEYKNEFLKNV